MTKTLLLVFIHGFKGGETTFGDKYRFADDLRAILADRLPRISIQTLVYPTYETRGDLDECVAEFRDWLLNKAIDLEVLAGTPSPTVDPSVRVLLIGHSMGGIVAAETALALACDLPLDGSADAHSAAEARQPLNKLMFPYVQGVLAFDTPFLGIAPGVVAHGAEGHYTRASAAVSQINEIGEILWGATAFGKSETGAKATNATPAHAAAHTSSRSKTSISTVAETASTQGWGRWSKAAVYAGAVGALAASGAAAYMSRDHLVAGWTWASSHLEFVGCLARPEELKQRVARMARLERELAVGFANIYTRLGKGADAADATSQGAGTSMVGRVLGADRTFCNLPSRMDAGTWKEAVNDKALDETVAHMTMFEEKENPAYSALVNDAAKLIVQWTTNDWYRTSSTQKAELSAADEAAEPG